MSGNDKLLSSYKMTYSPDGTAHTKIICRDDGTTTVQHFGAGHVVEGSSQVIELRPGETITIRHLA